jgi:hypothetical protein
MGSLRYAELAAQVGRQRRLVSGERPPAECGDPYDTVSRPFLVLRPTEDVDGVALPHSGCCWERGESTQLLPPRPTRPGSGESVVRLGAVP